MLQKPYKPLIICLMLMLIGFFPPLQASSEVECEPGKVCRIKATSLPLRGLPRPMSNFYAEPNDAAKVLASNVKAFWPLYIFARKDIDLSDPANPQGWYRVGTMVNDPWAWMKAKDVLEWKQALVVSYTHPGRGEERRHPVLMFKTQDNLANLVEQSQDERIDEAEDIYQGLKQSPPDIPEVVISREPNRFISIEEKFYMLPVVDFTEVDIFLDETRYLQLAAAIPTSSAGEAGARAEPGNADTLENIEFAEQAAQMETVEGSDIQTLVFDIKFVMDMTGSMGPYIAQTKEAVGHIAKLVSQNKTEGQIRYGLIGYRDDITVIPELEFTVKNFTPDLVDESGFQQVLETAKAAPVGSRDYQEEVFAGVQEAITSSWSENSIKFIVLVGDASSHEVNHPQNTSGTNAQEIRQLADTKNIQIIPIHLKDPQALTDHATAQAQFTQLGRNKGEDNPAYLDVPAHDLEAFEAIVKNTATALSEVISNVRQGNINPVSQSAQNIATEEGLNDDVADRASQIAQDLAANALVQYLGKEATPPRDLTAWVVDRDLIDPDVRSLEVRVLLKKRELNDLILALETIQKAIKRGQVTQMEFFDALQSTVASTTQGQDVSFDKAKNLSESGLLPNWIESLPYKSAILEMSNELFESLSADERSSLENDVDSKIELYRQLNENADLWIKLDERDPRDEAVYPLPLTALP